MQAVRKAPRAMPGTNPAANDFPEKEFGDESFSFGISFELAASVAPEIAELVGEDDVALVEEGLLAAASAALCATHTFAPLQVYPIGQQAFPHVSSSAVGFECS